MLVIMRFQMEKRPEVQCFLLFQKQYNNYKTDNIQNQTKQANRM